MSDLIDIADLNEATVLAALYNRARPQGLGLLHFTPDLMDEAEAASLLREQRRFDYLKGRVMKIGFFDPERQENDRNQPGKLVGEWLYDRDNGPGALAGVLATLRSATAKTG
jgi:hypothetical protein